MISFDIAEYNDLYEEQEVLGEGCIGIVKKLVNKMNF